ncbi:MAG: hypothetical protein JWQ74_2493 [Marmoricola sp.]|nr:hypothetical protein [Marmoricola sp.]
MPESFEFPAGPFGHADLEVRGISRGSLRRALACRSVRRLTRGVYVRSDVPDSLELRVAVLARVVSPGHVACDRTAAWLHGVDLHGGRPSGAIPAVEICALPGHPPTSRGDVRGRTRDLLPGDIEEHGDVLVTTPLRTALDLGCILRRADALAALDQLRRSFGLTQQDLARSAVRYVRRRGVVQLRELIPLSDPRAESVRESWTRLAILDAGLPAPVPQLEIEVGGVVVVRLDHGYPDQRVAVEYDGYEFHHTEEQLAHDERRRRWLRESGWRCIVVRRGDFTGRDLEAWISDLRDSLRSPYSNLRW